MPTPEQEIDLILGHAGGWKAEKLAELRNVIVGTDNRITEAVKWKMPSKPLGSATWEVNGILCVADILKNAVRLTFPNGAKFSDPEKLFNARLDSKVARAIDFSEDHEYSRVALEEIVRQAISVNIAKAK